MSLPAERAASARDPRAPRAAVAALAALIVVGAIARALAVSPAPDGWDGVGFVEAVGTFDLATFRPHPPGYPLFVVACRLLAALGVPALVAVAAVSIALGALLPLAGWSLARRTAGGTRAPLAFAAILALAPGLVVAGAATLPDAAALTLALAAYACALDPRPSAPMRTGLLVAATLGVRPIALLFVLPALLLVVRRHRGRGLGAALVATALGVATWALPTAKVLGAARWWALSRAQLEGHLGRWGESDAAWRGPGRLVATAQATALQLFGIDHVVLGGALAVLVALSLALVLAASRREPLDDAQPRTSIGALVVALGLAAAVAIALGALQPMAASPRHALPLAVAVAILFAHALDVALPPARPTSLVAGPIVLCLAYAAGRAVAVHRGPPAAVAMLRFVAHAPELQRATIVAGRASRFSAWGDGARVVPGAEAGDAVIHAMRAEPFPDPLLVTSELDLRGVPAERLIEVGRFSRESPLDRREADLVLWRMTLPP